MRIFVLPYTESECPNREGGAQEVGISLHVGLSVVRSSKYVSLRSTPASVQPPETTNLEPSIVQELCQDLGRGFLASRLRTKVSSIGCISTPSPPNNTSRFPAAQALKLQREGSTAPPTTQWMQHPLVSSVIRCYEPRPHQKAEECHTSLGAGFPTENLIGAISSDEFEDLVDIDDGEIGLEGIRNNEGSRRGRVIEEPWLQRKLTLIFFRSAFLLCSTLPLIPNAFQPLPSVVLNLVFFLFLLRHRHISFFFFFFFFFSLSLLSLSSLYVWKVEAEKDMGLEGGRGFSVRKTLLRGSIRMRNPCDGNTPIRDRKLRPGKEGVRLVIKWEGEGRNVRKKGVNVGIFL
ncbi:Adagio protein 3 [Senna tora]|uniref:Adagio protein 3 n=1 Tax=Senna tora TaxID=362788 RepID=A0A834SRK3_9FABA|nr:Adagio protein 3 [Senna tora]